ncbi:MAG: hypothetical protein IJI14_08325 [Anaerolineaceae bacterium]|nr:hypothetical protein [Anaerolineaceae bacterium]
MKKLYIVFLAVLLTLVVSVSAFAYDKPACGVDAEFDRLEREDFDNGTGMYVYQFPESDWPNPLFYNFVMPEHHMPEKPFIVTNVAEEKEPAFKEFPEIYEQKKEHGDNYEQLYSILDILKNSEGYTEISLSIEDGRLLDFSIFFSNPKVYDTTPEF